MGCHFRFQFLLSLHKKFLYYAFCVEELKSEYFEYFTNIFEYLLNRYTTFLSPVDTRQLPREIPVYIGKKHYQVGEKNANVSFVWHPGTLFQPNDNSVETSFS